MNTLTTFFASIIALFSGLLGHNPPPVATPQVTSEITQVVETSSSTIINENAVTTSTNVTGEAKVASVPKIIFQATTSLLEKYSYQSEGDKSVPPYTYRKELPELFESGKVSYFSKEKPTVGVDKYEASFYGSPFIYYQNDVVLSLMSQVKKLEMPYQPILEGSKGLLINKGNSIVYGNPTDGTEYYQGYIDSLVLFGKSYAYKILDEQSRQIKIVAEGKEIATYPSEEGYVSKGTSLAVVNGKLAYITYDKNKGTHSLFLDSKKIAEAKNISLYDITNGKLNYVTSDDKIQKVTKGGLQWEELSSYGRNSKMNIGKDTINLEDNKLTVNGKLVATSSQIKLFRDDTSWGYYAINSNFGNKTSNAKSIEISTDITYGDKKFKIDGMTISVNILSGKVVTETIINTSDKKTMQLELYVDDKKIVKTDGIPGNMSRESGYIDNTAHFYKINDKIAILTYDSSSDSYTLLYENGDKIFEGIQGIKFSYDSEKNVTNALTIKEKGGKDTITVYKF